MSASSAASGRARLSVVTPAFNEAGNLPVFYDRLVSALDAAGVDWEWVVVDDHSRDTTFDVVRQLAARDPRVRGVRLARNSGSHIAIACGLHLAQGDAAAVLAADLQDPPETIVRLLERWRGGAQVVWAVRERRAGEPRSVVWFSRLYYVILRRVVGLTQAPPEGADFFLLDRSAIEAIRRFGETHSSLFGLILWMGFRQESVTYVKAARLSGVSGWSLRRKMKLVVDSVVSFSSLPIRLITYAGGLLVLGGAALGAALAVELARGRPSAGWLWVLTAVVVLSGAQALMLGVLGEYLWRSLDETRRRPRYLIESSTGLAPDHAPDRPEGAAPSSR